MLVTRKFELQVVRSMHSGAAVLPEPLAAMIGRSSATGTY